MAFRDDDEARRVRIERLERDLDEARDELEAATLRAAEVEDLRRRVVTLTAERDMLEAGVEPAAAARVRQVARQLGGGLIVVIALAGSGWLTMRRESERAHAAEALADAERARAVDERDRLQHELDATRAELSEASRARDDDVASLQHDLRVAQHHDAPPAILVTAHVTSHTGDVLWASDGRCVLAVRSESPGACQATLTCGTTQVFPIGDRTADATCVDADEHPWAARDGTPLARLRGLGIDPTQPRFDYDASARTLVVTHALPPSSYALRMDVDSVVPFRMP